jgi:hypothetical protein
MQNFFRGNRILNLTSDGQVTGIRRPAAAVNFRIRETIDCGAVT